MFVLDTNIIIYYAAGQPEIVEFFQKHKERTFYLPTIVVTEFLSFPLISPGTAYIFKRFAAQTTILDLDFAIAELAAELRRRYNLKLADAIIAATTLISNSELITRNIKDFKKVIGLKLFKI